MTSLLLKGGEVIDPSRGLRERLDVAVKDGTVARIDPSIEAADADRTIDVSGKLVVPGLIDLHTHVYDGVNQNGIDPDLAGVRSGVTTVVDAGSAGCYTFGGFSRYVVPGAATRIVCFLHIARTGLSYQPEISAGDDIDLGETVRVVTENRPLVQGVKLRAIGPSVPVLGMELFHLAKRARARGRRKADGAYRRQRRRGRPLADERAAPAHGPRGHPHPPVHRQPWPHP